MTVNRNNFKIGIIGGMGPLATADLFNNIINLCAAKGAVQDYQYPEIIVSSRGLDGFDETGITDPETVRQQLIDKIKELNKMEVDAIAIPCNSVHTFYDDMSKVSNATILHIAECALSGFDNRNKVGILCSESSIRDNYYTEVAEKLGLNIEYLTSEEDQKTVTKVVHKVMSGKAGEGDHKSLVEMSEKLLEAKGCDKVILGCTELPLAWDGSTEENVKSSTKELARCLVELAYSNYKIN